jgi:hypothetical protein
MNDPRRVWAERLRVITEEEARSIRSTAFYRPGYPYGYVAVMDPVYYERHYGRQFAESVYGPSEGRYASGNGYYRNGTYANGYVGRNGTYRNGTAANGTYRNGAYTNGTYAAGTRNGTYTNGSRVAGSRTVYVAPRRRAAR